MQLPRALAHAILLLSLTLLVAGSLPLAATPAAQAQGEATPLRYDEHTQLFLNAAGNVERAVVSFAPLHYLAADGYRNIDPRLIQEEGALQNAAGPLALQLSAATAPTQAGVATQMASAPSLSLASASQQLILVPEGGAAVPPQQRETRAVYHNIYPGVDWEVESLNVGAAHGLVIKRPQTAARFSWLLSTNGGAARLDSEGTVTLEPCLQGCLAIRAPIVRDAAGDLLGMAAVTLELLGEGQYRLSYALDELLQNPVQSYPLAVSTTVALRGAGPFFESYFKASAPNAASCDNERLFGVGYDVNPAASPPIDRGNTRSFLAFPLPPGAGTITSARLHVFQYAPHRDATSYTALLHRVTEEWVSRCLSFGGAGPSFEPTALDEQTIDRSLGFKGFDFTTAAQAWAAGAPNYGLAIISAQEAANQPGSYFCASLNEGGLDNLCGTGSAQRIPYIEVIYDGTAPPPPPPAPQPVQPVDVNVTVSPASVPANGSTTATITVSGLPSGRQVRITSSRGSLDTLSRTSGAADGAGTFVATIRSSEPGISIITVRDQATGRTMSDTPVVTFTVPPGSTKPTPPTLPPVTIADVQSTFDLNGYYPSNIPSWFWDSVRGTKLPIVNFEPAPLPDRTRVEVIVDWGRRAPGRVELLINGRRVAEAATTSRRAEMEFNLVGSLPAVGKAQLTIVAIAADGTRSQPRPFSPTAWQLDPVQASYIIQARGVFFGEKVLYQYNHYERNGQIELELAIPSRSIRNLVSIMDGQMGMKDAQVVSSFFIPVGKKEIEVSIGPGGDVKERKYRPKLKGSTNGANGGSFILGQTETGFEVKGFGKAEVSPSGQVVWRAVGAQILFKIKYKETYSVLVVIRFIPGVGEALYAGVRPVERYIRPFANAYWSIEGRVGGTAEIGLQPVELLTLQLDFGGTVEIGAEVDVKLVSLELSAGLEADLAVKIKPLETPEFTGRGYAKACWGFLVGGQECREGEVKITVPKDSDSQAGLANWEELSVVQPYTLPGHGYSTPYAQYVSNEESVSVALGPLDQPFVTNVFTRTQLTATPGQGGALAAWVHDDITRPVGQNLDIAFSGWDGSRWLAPERITSDTNLDTAPSLASSGSGYVAAWQRIKAATVAATLPPEQLDPLIEIAVAVSGPGGSSWPTPTLLTDNAAVDYDPFVAGGSTDGSALVVWKQNPSRAGGTESSPDILLVSRWDGSGWSAPATLSTGLVGYSQHTAAMRGTGAAFVAFTRELAVSTEITPVVTLNISTWNGSSWSPPTVVPTSARAVDSPQALYLPSGNPAVVFIGDRTLTLRDLATGQEWRGPAASGGLVRVAQDSTGNLVAVWEEGVTGGLALRASIFDGAYQIWSTPRTLTDSGEKDRFATPLLLNTGALLVPYARTATLTQTRTLTSDTGQPFSVVLNVNGQTDLRSLTYPLQRNLLADSSSVTLSNPRPIGGETITVTAQIENTGDYAEDSVLVQLFVEEPTAGGQLVSSQTIDVPIGAGGTAEVRFRYLVPKDTSAQNLVIVVDPADVIAEADESDNIARLRAFGADLEVLTAGGGFVQGTEVEIVAVVRNGGTAASVPGTLAVFLDEGGTPILTDPLPVLVPGEVITRSLSWDGSPLQPGTYALTTLAVPGDGDEPIMTNNSYLFTLDAGPDVMVNPLALWRVPIVGNVVRTEVITTTVANIGPLPAENIEVQVFASTPTGTGRLLFTRVIPSLQPGAAVNLEGVVQGPLPCGVTVLVDPEARLLETRTSNNTALIIPEQARCAAWLYLPVVRR